VRTGVEVASQMDAALLSVSQPGLRSAFHSWSSPWNLRDPAGPGCATQQESVARIGMRYASASPRMSMLTTTRLGFSTVRRRSPRWWRRLTLGWDPRSTACQTSWWTWTWTVTGPARTHTSTPSWWSTRPARRRVDAVGSYDDQLIRTTDGWRITVRVSRIACLLRSADLAATAEPKKNSHQVSTTLESGANASCW